MKGSIEQRAAGSWQITVDLGVDAQGKRHRHRETVRGTREQADRRLDTLLRQRDRGELGVDPNPPMSRWLEGWLRKVVRRDSRQGTVERYEKVVRLYIDPSLGQVRLRDVAPKHVQQMHDDMEAAGLSAKTIRLARAVLSGALKEAVQLELVARNPVAIVKAPRLQRRKVDSPEVAAVHGLLWAAEEEDHYLKAAIYLIANTGLRRGEALALTWDKVDLARGHVVVTGSLSETTEFGINLVPPKTPAGRRVVDIDEDTIDVLRRHRARMDEWKMLLGEEYEDHGRVFTGPVGEWVRPQKLTKAVRSLGERAGYPGMTVHQLRHFHATLALQSGQNPVVVSQRLGHENVSITMDIYADVLTGWQKQLADEVARVFRGG